MAELADAIDLGSIVNRRAGSSPVIRSYENVVNLLICDIFLKLNLEIRKE